MRRKGRIMNETIKEEIGEEQLVELIDINRHVSGLDMLREWGEIDCHQVS